MKRFFRIGWWEWAAALVTAGGCTTLLGVNQDYHGVVDDGVGGQQATNSSASGVNATGSGGGADSSATSSTGSGSACTIVHGGGKGTCEYLPGKECGCSGAGQKCSVPDSKQASGASACVPVSTPPRSTWDACDTDSNCGPGVWCDHALHICKPICVTTDQCPANARCVPVLANDTTTAIPGLDVCTAHCDPTSAMPCGANTTCYYDATINEFDCLESGTAVAGASCNFANDCVKGLVCLGSNGTATCERWCGPADGNVSAACSAADSSKPFCVKFGMMPTYNGVVYGVCSS